MEERTALLSNSKCPTHDPNPAPTCAQRQEPSPAKPRSEKVLGNVHSKFPACEFGPLCPFLLCSYQFSAEEEAKKARPGLPTGRLRLKSELPLQASAVLLPRAQVTARHKRFHQLGLEGHRRRNVAVLVGGSQEGRAGAEAAHFSVWPLSVPGHGPGQACGSAWSS